MLRSIIYFVIKNLNFLRFSLTHGDANNYNLVVNQNKIVGLLDYGDMVFAPTINDLSVSLAYALMKKVNFYSTLKILFLVIIKFFQFLFMKHYH